MNFFKSSCKNNNRTLKVVTASLALSAFGFCQANALPPITTQETLLDRIQIEDILYAYYHGLESEEGHDFAAYYTDDAILDVNGYVAEGKAEIQDLYESYAEISPEEMIPGKVHVMLNNPRIIIEGDTARAYMLWTETVNETVKLAPRLIEQGKEYTEFRKVDGQWLMSKRLIWNSGGLSDSYDDLYEDRTRP